MADSAPISPIRAEDLPELPTSHLPKAVRDMVGEASRTIDVDISMPCLMATTLMASLYQSRVEVQVTPGHVEPLCIYSCVLANPGERKTSTMNSIMGCIRKASTSLHHFWKTEQAVREYKITASKDKVAMLLADPSTNNPENPELQAAIHDAGMTPGLKQFLLEDITPAAFIQALSISPTALILSDEGEVWKKLSSGQGEDIGLWLRAHTGDTYLKNRKTQEPVYIERPVASVLLAMQPGIIRSSSNIRGLSDQGLVARFFWCVTKSRIGQRVIGAIEQDQEIMAKFQDWSGRVRILIADHQSKEKGGQYKGVTTLPMSKEAEAVWKQWAGLVEYESRTVARDFPVVDLLPESVASRMSIGNNGDYRRISAAASKAAGATARIAGAASADRIFSGGEAGVFRWVTGEEMLAAVEFMSAQLEHTKAVRALMDGESAEDQFAIIEYFNEHGWPLTCKRGWLTQIAKDICQNRDSAEAAIEHLIERGYFHKTGPTDLRCNEHLIPEAEKPGQQSSFFPPA